MNEYLKNSIENLPKQNETPNNYGVLIIKKLAFLAQRKTAFRSLCICFLFVARAQQITEQKLEKHLTVLAR